MEAHPHWHAPIGRQYAVDDIVCCVLEVKMEELKWEHLTDVQGRFEADILKAYFEEYGIEITTFQESLGQHIYPTTLDILGNVQIFVAKEQAEAARKLLEEYDNAKEVDEEKEE
jgi:hypothetical protein